MTYQQTPFEKPFDFEKYLIRQELKSRFEALSNAEQKILLDAYDQEKNESNSPTLKIKPQI